jgi:hypothetical protein
MSRFVPIFDMLKAGWIMMKQKFGTIILSHPWLTATCCAEKTTAQRLVQEVAVRLFWD